VKTFLSRFGAFILSVLSGFDRLRFRGTNRLLSNPRGVHSYLYQQAGRRVRALNPLTGANGALLRTMARGDFLLEGLRNRDLRVALLGETAEPRQQRRQAAAVTGKLRLLRAHGIISKIQKTHRYQISAQGRRIVTALLSAHAADADRLAAAA
jgi:hypothetical protein